MNFFKQFFKAFACAFSLYSKIPMPHFNLQSEDMKYHLCFFPLVGLVTGALDFLFVYFLSGFFNNKIFTSCIFILIPFLVTGGFHFDGFMDTSDALHSYAPKEKKLEIMKDPHVGSFAIICAICYVTALFAFVSTFSDIFQYFCICYTFIISRIFSGLSVCFFPKAKKDGIVYTNAKNQNPVVVRISLLLQLIIYSGILILLIFLVPAASFKYALAALVCAAASFLYFYFFSKKNFGGITGDLCGWYVCITELLTVISISVLSLL